MALVVNWQIFWPTRAGQCDGLSKSPFPKRIEINVKIPNSAVREIAEDPDFSGFLSAESINGALTVNPSLNLSMVVEDDPEGKTKQPTERIVRSQERLGEPQAHSSILVPEEEPVDATELLAGSDSGLPVDERESKRTSRKRKRQRLRARKQLVTSMARLSTSEPSTSSQTPVTERQRAEAATTGVKHNSGNADTIANKRGRSSPEDLNPNSKRVRKGGHPDQPSYAAAAKELVLTATPLDMDVNPMPESPC